MTPVYMKKKIANVFTLSLCNFLMLINLDSLAKAEDALVDKFSFDESMDSDFEVVKMNTNGSVRSISCRDAVRGKAVRVNPSTDESYVKFSGFPQIQNETTITFWAKAWGRRIEGEETSNLRMFQFSSQGDEPNPTHILSLYSDSTIEARVLDATFQYQSFESVIQNHDPYEWNLYVYSYSPLTGQIKVGVNSNWVIQAQVEGNGVIEPATELKMGNIEIGSKKSVDIDDFRVYSKALSSDAIKSVINDVQVSLEIEPHEDGFKVTVNNFARKKFTVVRLRNLDSNRWERAFVCDPKQTTQTFIDPVIQSSSGIFYRIKFPR